MLRSLYPELMIKPPIGRRSVGWRSLETVGNCWKLLENVAERRKSLEIAGNGRRKPPETVQKRSPSL